MPRSTCSFSAKCSVTLATVAARVGVSPQTVSNAINSPDMLRPETLERVRRAIDETGYRPSRAAQTLRTRSSKLIGYGIRPSPLGTTPPVMDRFLHALSEAADEAGYRILLFASPPSGASLQGYEELLDQHDVDGFVLSGTSERGDPRQPWLDKRGVPFVTFGRMRSKRPIGDWVDVDSAAGTDAAVKHLISLGHRKIAFLGWQRNSGVGDDRAEGWQRAMRRHDLPTRRWRAQSTNDADAALTAVKPLLNAGATAVVAASDTLALGCCYALRERGAIPGHDVAVVGFDDSPTAGILSPGLTTLAQPLEAAGRECVRLLLARMADGEAPPQRVLLEPSLVLRDDTPAADAVMLADRVG